MISRRCCSYFGCLVVVGCVLWGGTVAAETTAVQEGERQTSEERQEDEAETEPTSGSEQIPEEAVDGDERYDRLGIEEATGLARGTLVASQTIHGALLGLQGCIVVNCDSPRLGVGLPALGAATGFGLTFYATHDRGVTPGQSAALNTGVWYGSWTAITGALAVDAQDERAVFGSMMALQLAGLAGGYALSEVLRPTAGDVSLARHSALWMAVLYPMVTEGVLALDQSERAIAAGMWISSTLGGVGGAVLAGNKPMSRSRVLVTSASGLVGGLAGMIVPVLIFEDDLPNRQTLWVPTLIGGAAGLATGAYLTREWDDDADFRPETATPMFSPSFDGEGVVAGMSGQF